MIKVLFFAVIADKLGQKELWIDEDLKTVQDVTHWLEQKYPEAKQDIEKSMIALNEKYCERHMPIQKHDVIAVIPPVSGG